MNFYCNMKLNFYHKQKPRHRLFNKYTHTHVIISLQLSHYTVTADDDEMIIFLMSVVRLQVTILNRDTLPVCNI